MRYFWLELLILFVAVGLYLSLWPTPIDPVAYDPPESPSMTGVLEPNALLGHADYLGSDKLAGPEDIAVDEKGRVYTGTAQGLIRRITLDGEVETFAETGGRPLGMEFDPEGNLIAADARKGLLRIDPRGRVEVLSTGSQSSIWDRLIIETQREFLA